MDEKSKTARDVGALCEYAATTYPTRGLWTMLGGDGSDRFAKAAAHREFCISYLSGDSESKTEKLQRHISFDNEDALRDFMRRRRPVRLDVGGVCTIRPKVRRTNQAFFLTMPSTRNFFRPDARTPRAENSRSMWTSTSTTRPRHRGRAAPAGTRANRAGRS